MDTVWQARDRSLLRIRHCSWRLHFATGALAPFHGRGRYAQGHGHAHGRPHGYAYGRGRGRGCDAL